MSKIHAVIIGAIHHNTLGVLRSLGEGGIQRDHIDIILIGINPSKRNIISASKYVEKNRIVYVDTYDEIVNALIKMSSDAKKRVVLCCADGATEVVIKFKSILREYFYLPECDDISELMKKDTQDEIAESCGLSTPQSITCMNKYEMGYWNLYPCIIKPIKSIAGGGKSDIRVANNASELNDILRDIQTESIQIQQFIAKKMEFQLIGCSLNNGDIIIIPGFTRIVRQPQNTNTGYLEYSPINELDFDITAVRHFIEKIRYSGLFSVEFIRGVDNKDYFLEINMRNDGNAYCVESAGVNLPYIWSYYNWYGSIPNVKIEIDKHIWFIPDFNDLKVSLKDVGLFHWMIDFIKAKSHSIFNLRDPLPFFIELLRIVKIMLRYK